MEGLLPPSAGRASAENVRTLNVERSNPLTLFEPQRRKVREEVFWVIRSKQIPLRCLCDLRALGGSNLAMENPKSEIRLRFQLRRDKSEIRNPKSLTAHSMYPSARSWSTSSSSTAEERPTPSVGPPQVGIVCSGWVRRNPSVKISVRARPAKSSAAGRPMA